MNDAISSNPIHGSTEPLYLINLALTERVVYLARKAVCMKIDFSESAIKRWVKEDNFPKPVMIMDKPRWIESEVDSWIERQNPSRLVAVEMANQVAKDAAAIIKNL